MGFLPAIFLEAVRVSCKNPLPPEKVVLFYLKTDRYWKNEAEDSHTFFSRRSRTLLHSKNKY